MKKFLYFLIIIFTFSSKAEIIETENLPNIKKEFLKLLENYEPHKILGIFGINNTILTPLEPELNFRNENFLPLMKKAFSQLKGNNAIYLSDIIFTNYKHILVDKNLPSFIQELITKGVPLIAITTNLTGNLNEIKRLEVWRHSYLKSYNIDFSGSFPKITDIFLQNMQSFQSSYPNFYYGILSSNKNYTKAQVLVNFLQQIKFNPQVIIAIDYNLEELNGLEQQLNSYNKNIKFIGFHFTSLNKIEYEDVDGQKFINFWYKLIDKINKVKRKNTFINKNNPYDE